MIDDHRGNNLSPFPVPDAGTLKERDNSTGTLPPAYHHLFALVMQSPAAMCLLLGAEHRFVLANPAYCALVGKPSQDLLGKAVRVAFPELDGQPFFGLLDRVYQAGEAFVGNEMMIRWNRQATGQPEDSWLNFVYQPVVADDGQVAGIFVHAVDVTEQVLARQAVDARNAEIARLNAALEAQVAQLHESQRLTQAILDSTSAFIFVKDTAGRYLLANRPMCISAGRDDLSGYTDEEIFPLSYAQQWKETDAQVIATGTAVEREELHLQEDGVHTYLSLKFPITDSRGTIYAVGSVSTDITERKQSEQERADLLAREQSARTAAEQAATRTARLQAVTAALSKALTPDAVLNVMLEQGLDALCAQAGSVMQVTSDGSALELVQAQGYRPEILARWQRIPLTLDTPLTEAVRTGTAIWMESPAQLAAHYPAMDVKRGKGAWVAIPLWAHTRTIGAVGLRFAEARTFATEERDFMQALVQQCAQALERARLYTEAQRLEEQARQHAERMQVLADMAQAFATVGMEAQSVLEYVARRVAEVLGDCCIIRLVSDDRQWLTTATMHHRDPEAQSLLHHLHNHPIPMTGSLSGQVMQTGVPLLIPMVEPTHLPPAASPDYQDYLDYFHLSSLLLVPLRVRGQVIGTIGLVGDISGCVYTPDDQWFVQALADRAALALDTTRLYAAEQQARAAAEVAVQLRDKMFSLVSHDLLNPVSAILGYTQLLQRKLRSKGEQDVEHTLQRVVRIEEAAHHVVAQIQELRDIARLQSQRPLDLQFARLDLAQLVQRVVGSYAHLHEGHRVQLEVVAEAITLTGDAVRLERVLRNLLSNAFKYSPQGSTVAVTLALQAQENRPGVLLTVQDAGMGIPEEDLPFLFTPFRRGSNVVGKIEGTGLGLAGVRQIIEQHGGTITVASVEGEGTTFRIWVTTNDEYQKTNPPHSKTWSMRLDDHLTNNEYQKTNPPQRSEE